MHARWTLAVAAGLVATGGLGAAPAAVASHTPYAASTGWDIWAVGLAFAPAAMVAQPGETVTWYGFGHTATALDGAFDFDLGGTASWTVPEGAGPAVHVYRCVIHPGMLGVLVVL
ncbi:MAG TPA: hypothetical protein VGR28_09680 [Candidatus Thermoplasmatota archaeon]|jgi:plastocyanin|nr:hypothetical protein [Candidatus Thermoplasmatota archaeon]